MAFQFDVKKAGDLIKSTDWNNLNTETARLGNDKVDRAGDTINGGLTVTGKVNVGGPLSVTGASTLTGNARVSGTLTITGASTLTGNASMGGTLSVTGASTFNNAVSITGNVGIGTTTPGERLEVNGRVKAGAVTIGPWPANANYTFFGTNTLDQSTPGNYALLQETTAAGKGITFLNSPEDIRFRIGNADKMVLTNNGNVGIGTTAPTAMLEVNGTAKAREFLTTLYTDGNKAAFALSTANQWADVADLTRTFSLAQETAVLVYYQITTNGGQHLVTRLLVDNVDVVFGRSIVGNTVYWSSSSLWISRLVAGSHTIKVQYRTPGGGTSNPSADDWQNRVLHILVFGS